MWKEIVERRGDTHNSTITHGSKCKSEETEKGNGESFKERLERERERRLGQHDPLRR